MLYLHIPYCRRKCPYCDFYSGGARLADWSRLVDALLAELDARIDEHPVPPESIYIGGGTPSLLPPAEFLRLAEGVASRFGGMRSGAEFTIEVNPDDISEANIEAWRKGGVNRVSVGVQSLDDAELRAVGRLHDAESARRGVARLSEAFSNVSVDLMFALPGQTVDSLMRNVEGVVAMRPQHVSAYALMYEEGTALTRLRDESRLAEADEDTYVEMFSRLSEALCVAGYLQYEISNYSLTGFESRHNSGYWKGFPYLGLGPSAHSYDGNALRRANPGDLRGYFEAAADGFATPFYTEERLSADELREEYILTRMRMASGLDTEDFRSRFGEEAHTRLMANAVGQMEAGLLYEETPLRLTRKGVMVSDEVILALAL